MPQLKKDNGGDQYWLWVMTETPVDVGRMRRLGYICVMALGSSTKRIIRP